MRRARDYVNGIGVCSIVRARELGFGNSIYEEQDLTTPLLLPGVPTPNGTAVSLTLKLSISDKDAQYPINLARTSAIGHDQNVTDKIDTGLSEIYQRELAAWRDWLFDNETPAPTDGHFKIDMGHVVFRNGDVLLNDISIMRQNKVTYVSRLHEPARFILDLSRKIQDVALYGSANNISSKTSVMQFLRDQHYAVALSYSRSSIVMIDDAYLVDIGRTAPNWLARKLSQTKSIAHNGRRKSIMTFGAVSKEMTEIFERIVSATKSTVVELYSSDGNNYDWNRWQAQRKDEESVFAKYLLSRSQPS